MKKTLLFMLGCLPVLSLAQPTITSAVNPVAGDNIAYTNCNWMAPGTAGANQTWNYASLSTTSTSVLTFVAASGTPYASTYIGANVAQDVGGGTYDYYTTSASVFSHRGLGAGSPGDQYYHNGEDYLHFPFTYLDTYTDAFACNYGPGPSTYRTGSWTITADGYGTLILPNGTHTNVLRVHMNTTFQDSTMTGTVNNTYDFYWYYKTGNHFPILMMNSYTTMVGSYQFANYRSSVVDVTEEEAFWEMNMFPNPTANEVTLQNVSEIETIEIANLSGKMVQTISPSQGMNMIKLNVAELPEGMYVVTVHNRKGVSSSRKLLIAR